MTAPALILLRPAALDAIRRRIDLELVAAEANPDLQARLRDARRDLLRPLDLLGAAGLLAGPALADDHAAIQRLRLLLAATATVFEIDGAGSADVAAAVTRFASLARTSGEVLSAASGAAVGDDDPDLACSPGVLDHGALMVVGCACLRAGAIDGLGTALLGTLHGLALAAGPAEAVLRWERLHGTDVGFVDFLLAFAGIAGRPGLNLRALAALVMIDRCERERWRCLQRLLGEGGKGGLVEVMRGLDDWSATDVRGLTAVAPLGGERWQLNGSFAPQRVVKRKNKVIEERAVVVAGRQGVTPAVVEAAVLSWSDNRIEVRVPGGLAGGWFGFTSRTRVDTANQSRANARTRLAALAAKEMRCLPGDIPVDTIGDLAWPPAPAPGHGAEPPVLVSADFAGGTWSDPAHPATVLVTSAPVTTPAWVWLEEAGATSSTSAARTPMVAGKATLSVPQPLVRDGVHLRVQLAGQPEGPARDARDLPPLRVGGTRRVMVVRPRLVDGDGVLADRQVTTGDLLKHLTGETERLGLGLAYQELPELDDALAVMTAAHAVGQLADPAADDPAVERVLVALALAAVRTPGAEDAWWVAVVPGEGAWTRIVQGAGAACIAVATIGGCAEVLREKVSNVSDQPLHVLRLIARSAGRRRLMIIEALTEQRRRTIPVVRLAAQTDQPRLMANNIGMASSLAPLQGAALVQDLRFAAVQRDAGGRMLQVSRLATLGVDRLMTALIPLRPGTTMVELVALAGEVGVSDQRAAVTLETSPDLSDASVVARVDDGGGSPQIGLAQVSDGHLRLRAGHSGGRPLMYSLEARLAPPLTLGPLPAPAVEATWCRLVRWREACSTCCRPPWHRFSLWTTDVDGAVNALALRVVADDGWTAVEQLVDGTPPAPAQQVRIRRLDDGRLLAEGPVGEGQAAPRWHLQPQVAAGLAASEAPRLLGSRVVAMPEDGDRIELVAGAGGNEIRERLGAAMGDDGCIPCEDDDG